MAPRTFSPPGGQTEPSFATYPIDGLATLATDVVLIHFADGHVPAVISASALSLPYPQDDIAPYSRPAFTDGRRSVKLDPTMAPPERPRACKAGLTNPRPAPVRHQSRNGHIESVGHVLLSSAGPCLFHRGSRFPGLAARGIDHPPPDFNSSWQVTLDRREEPNASTLERPRGIWDKWARVWGSSWRGNARVSPRAVGRAVLLLSICLLFAVAMLAMLSAESDQGMTQAPHAFSSGEMLGPSTANSGGETAPHPWVADLGSETALISRC